MEVTRCVQWIMKEKLITLKFNSDEKIQFKILYKDYLKLKNKIQNIILK